VAKKKAPADDPGLLAQVLERPDDDAPRLVYADWYEEHGQVHRAEFIRLQCRLAQLGEQDPERLALEQREADLWFAYRTEWQSRKFAGEFRRGFVHKVRRTASMFLRAGEDLFAAVPVEELQVSAVRTDWAAFAASPLLGRLSGLDLEYNRLGAEELRAVLAATRPQGLRALSLQSTGFRVEHARELARWPGLPHLRRLDLSQNRLDEAALAELAGTPFDSLTWLDLTNVGPITSLPARAARLAYLDLYNNAVEPGRLDRLAQDAPALTTLKVDGTERHTLELIESPLAARLESLKLYHYNAANVLPGPEVLGRLLRPAVPWRLRQLKADFLPLAEAFAGGVTLPLFRLEAGCCKLDARAVAGLASSPQLAGLRWLDLHQNPIGDDGARALAESPHLRRLQWLDLKVCDIGDEGLTALAGSPNLADLRHLTLLGNRHFPAGVRALASSPHLGELRVLEVNGYYAGADSVRALVRSPYLNNLRRLTLGTGFPREAQDELADPERLPRLLEVDYAPPAVQKRMWRKEVL
jgi:uncharacterized protein (TIGR02996 family)